MNLKQPVSVSGVPVCKHLPVNSHICIKELMAHANALVYLCKGRFLKGTPSWVCRWNPGLWHRTLSCSYCLMELCKPLQGLDSQLQGIGVDWGSTTFFEGQAEIMQLGEKQANTSNLAATAHCHLLWLVYMWPAAESPCHQNVANSLASGVGWNNLPC